MSPDASPIAPSSIDVARSARIRASSSVVGARSSAPMTHDRSVPWPTKEHTLIAGFTSSTASAYSPNDDQVRWTMRRESARSSSASAIPLTGADDPPQLPHTTSVTPMCNALSSASLTNIASSECEWMSMNPGAMTRSFASMTRAPSFARSAPTAAMRPRSIATSARRPGAPVPSITVAPRIKRSVTTGAARVPGRAPRVGIYAFPLVEDRAIEPGDDLGVWLEHVDRHSAPRRHVLADPREAGPAIVRVEHEERIEGDEDQRERLVEGERPHVALDP